MARNHDTISESSSPDHHHEPENVEGVPVMGNRPVRDERRALCPTGRLGPATQATLVATSAAGLATAIDRLDYNIIPTASVLTIAIGVAALVLAANRRLIAGPIAVLFALVFAIRERVLFQPVQNSDVLLATNEAIRVLAAGGNPYSHVYLDTDPPGSPFPYPIGEPLYYWIHLALFGDTNRADTWSGIIIMLVFVALVPVLGWARVAVAITGFGISITSVRMGGNGSNDIGMAMFVVAGLSLLIYAVWDRTRAEWRTGLLVASAFVFAWAILFKLFALVIFPFVVLALWHRRERWMLFSGISLGLTFVAMLPFLIDDFLGTIDYISRGGSHDFIFGLNVWSVLRHHVPDLVTFLEPHITLIQLSISGLIGIFLLLRVRSDIAQATMAGVGVCTSLVFLANWTSGSYYAGFWPIALLAAVSMNLPSLSRPNRDPRHLIPSRFIPDRFRNRAQGLDPGRRPRTSRQQPAVPTRRLIIARPSRASGDRLSITHRVRASKPVRHRR